MPSATGDLMGETSDHAAIARVTAELLDAVNCSDVSRVISVWSEEGVLMPPHHPSIHGRQALEAYFRDLFSRTKLSFVFTSSTIELDGGTAFEHVTYRATAWAPDGQPPREEHGKGLHVYRRQTDHSWKLVRDIWNSDTPVQK
jgi:uncharacterized protein (TIGR02246 family)